jgi:uncharacterized protein (TIGR00269 family)
VKCRVCREPAVIDIRRHNAGFCATCFVDHTRNQVERAIAEHRMARPDDRLLVAVSGGKDSLALWDLLLDLGYQADGLYLGLGIKGYSDRSAVYAREFAGRRGAKLIEVDLPRDLGYDIPSGSRAARRAPCSACGLSKRHLFDQVALEGGYDAIVTGHNLDDEVAVLFGNVLRWDLAYLARQHPVLPARDGFPRKIKPLVRLGERETAAYCVIRGIEYVIEECPMAEGNRHLGYKEALNAVEERSPGSKAAFYHGFLDRVSELVTPVASKERESLTACPNCGAPTTGELCAFCKLVERAGGQHQRRLIPVAVEVGGPEVDGAEAGEGRS